mgnify:CR=1 FL=1
MTASANIPDGFSMGELELLAQAAAHREEVDTDNLSEFTEGPLFDGKTQKEVEDIVSGLLALSFDECNDPMVHKIMLLEIITNMIEWHTKQGVEHFDNNETQSGVAWTRDAGKFQAAMGIILSVGVGPNDWTIPDN